MSSATGSRPRPSLPRRIGLSALVLLALSASALGGFLLAGGPRPADDSVEAGFARDMQTHHLQAVEMALIVREKSKDPVLRAVAYDIATSQQQQAGQMYGWLTQWGLSQTSSQPRMAWMASADTRGHGSMDGSSMAGGSMDGGSMGVGQQLLPDGRMPGMASAAELEQLRRASGQQAEVLFLRLMVAHHRGGIAMARAAADTAGRPEVVALAQSIARAQTAETEQLQQLLAERRQPPA